MSEWVNVDDKDMRDAEWIKKKSHTHTFMRKQQATENEEEKEEAEKR